MPRDDWRDFPPVPAPTRSERGGTQPMLVGLIGPPGSGKTRSMLRLMRGAQRVFGGPVVLIDTEAGRSETFSPKKGQPANPNDPVEPTYDFERIDLEAPYRSDRCWSAIEVAMKRKPAAIGFDNLSDEHQGPGGYLEWHEDEIARVGGNEWGAWARPAAARKRLCSGIGHIRAAPLLFFTFVAEEKTQQIEEEDERGRKKKKVVNKGWTPVAPLLILKTLNLTCILPWDSKGTPIWEARGLPYEDFIRKWPDHLVRLMKQGQLTEDHGEALARWAKGDDPHVAPGGDRASQAKPGPKTEAPAGTGSLLLRLNKLLTEHLGMDAVAREAAILEAFGADRKKVAKMPADQLEVGLATLTKNLEGLAALRAEAQREREPGED